MIRLVPERHYKELYDTVQHDLRRRDTFRTAARSHTTVQWTADKDRTCRFYVVDICRVRVSQKG